MWGLCDGGKAAGGVCVRAGGGGFRREPRDAVRVLRGLSEQAFPNRDAVRYWDIQHQVAGAPTRRYRLARPSAILLHARPHHDQHALDPTRPDRPRAQPTGWSMSKRCLRRGVAASARPSSGRIQCLPQERPVSGQRTTPEVTNNSVTPFSGSHRAPASAWRSFSLATSMNHSPPTASRVTKTIEEKSQARMARARSRIPAPMPAPRMLVVSSRRYVSRSGVGAFDVRPRFPIDLDHVSSFTRVEIW